MLRQLFWMVLIIGLCAIPIHRTTAQDTDDSNDAIRIWWPEALYTDETSQSIDTLFSDFTQTTTTEISPRIYVMNYNGETVVEQLHLINTIAPDAKPDIALMRRDDLNALVQQPLVLPDDDIGIYQRQLANAQSLSVWDTLAIVNEITPLSESLIELGEVNETIYGLPYLVEIEHMLYQPTAFDNHPTTVEDVLVAEASLLFPARPPVGQALNSFVMMLYVNAGGSFVDANGNPSLDTVPLNQTLTFIEDAVSAGIFDNDLLAYRNTADYVEILLTESHDFALVDSNLYLTNPELASYTVSGIPTFTDESILLVDGWVWVLLTDDPDRQDEAFQFVRWMFETDQIVDVALAVRSIPIQERALNALNDPYFEGVQELLADTTFVRGRRNQAAVALQSAFELVLNGTSAGEATTTAINSLVQETNSN